MPLSFEKFKELLDQGLTTEEITLFDSLKGKDANTVAGALASLKPMEIIQGDQPTPVYPGDFTGGDTPARTNWKIPTMMDTLTDTLKNPLVQQEALRSGIKGAQQALQGALIPGGALQDTEVQANLMEQGLAKPVRNVLAGRAINELNPPTSKESTKKALISLGLEKSAPPKELDAIAGMVGGAAEFGGIYLLLNTAFKTFGSLAPVVEKLNSPKIQGPLAGFKYRILKAMGVPQETGLVPLTEENLLNMLNRSPDISPSIRKSINVQLTRIANERAIAENKLPLAEGTNALRPAAAGPMTPSAVQTPTAEAPTTIVAPPNVETAVPPVALTPSVQTPSFIGIRQGPISKNGAYFSTSGMSTYYDESNPSAAKYDLTSLKIADTNNITVSRDILSKALLDKSNTKEMIIRIKESLQDGHIDYLMNDEIPSIVRATKGLGYDGIKVWENDDVGGPTSVFIWKVKELKPIVKGEATNFVDLLKVGKDMPVTVFIANAEKLNGSPTISGSEARKQLLASGVSGPVVQDQLIALKPLPGWTPPEYSIKDVATQVHTNLQEKLGPVNSKSELFQKPLVADFANGSQLLLHKNTIPGESPWRITEVQDGNPVKHDTFTTYELAKQRFDSRVATGSIGNSNVTVTSPDVIKQKPLGVVKTSTPSDAVSLIQNVIENNVPKKFGIKINRENKASVFAGSMQDPSGGILFDAQLPELQKALADATAGKIPDLSSFDDELFIDAARRLGYSGIDIVHPDHTKIPDTGQDLSIEAQDASYRQALDTGKTTIVSHRFEDRMSKVTSSDLVDTADVISTKVGQLVEQMVNAGQEDAKLSEGRQALINTLAERVQKLNEESAKRMGLRVGQEGSTPMFNFITALENALGMIESSPVWQWLQVYTKMLSQGAGVAIRHPEFMPVWRAPTDANGVGAEKFYTMAEGVDTRFISAMAKNPSISKRIGDLFELELMLNTRIDTAALIRVYKFTPQDLKVYDSIRKAYDLELQLEIETRKALFDYANMTPENKKLFDKRVNELSVGRRGHVSTQRDPEKPWIVAKKDVTTGDVLFLNRYAGKHEARLMAKRIGGVYFAHNNLKEMSNNGFSLDELDSLLDSMDNKDLPIPVRVALREQYIGKGLSTKWTHSKLIPGYEFTLKNILENLMNSLEYSAQRYARVTGKIAAEKALREMKTNDKSLKAYAKMFIDTYYSSGGEGYKGLLKVLYGSTMATNPKYLVLDLLAPWITTYPMMAKYYKGLDVEKKFLWTYGQTTKWIMDSVAGRKSTLPPQLLALLKSAHRQRLLGEGLNTFILDAKGMRDKQINNALTIFARSGEYLKRAHSFIVGYYIATEEKGLTNPDAIFRFMKMFVEETHQTFGKQNLPIALRKLGWASKAARTAYAFRGFNQFYIQSMIKMLSGNNGTRNRALMTWLATAGVFLGAKGVIDWASSELFGDTAEGYLRKWLYSKGVGVDKANVIIQGAGAVGGIDLSGSFGVDPMVDPKRDLASNLAGAAGTFPGNVGKFLTKMHDGEYRRSLDYIPLSYAANIARADTRAKQGVLTFDDMLIHDKMPTPAFATILNLTTSDMSNIYAEEKSKRAITAFHAKLTTRLTQEIAHAISTNNRKEEDRLWNEADKNDIKITNEMINNRLDKLEGIPGKVPRAIRDKIESTEEVFKKGRP